MSQKIDNNQLQLIIDLAADYSERIVAGEPASINDYLEKLPDEACRIAFKRAANMTRLIATIQNIQSDSSEADAEASQGTRDIQAEIIEADAEASGRIRAEKIPSLI
jgi:hypothetical protein